MDEANAKQCFPVGAVGARLLLLKGLKTPFLAAC